jgi:hypothetical protein
MKIKLLIENYKSEIILNIFNIKLKNKFMNKIIIFLFSILKNKLKNNV